MVFPPKEWFTCGSADARVDAIFVGIAAAWSQKARFDDIFDGQDCRDESAGDQEECMDLDAIRANML